MRRRNLKAKWTLPEIVNPADRLCFTIPVPNEKYHLAAFRGAILNLASAINWQDDVGHTAKDVAVVWQQIYDEIEACMSAVTDVRQNPVDLCKLEKSIDNGAWIEFADLQKCPPDIRTNLGKLQYFNGAAWVDLPGQGDERQNGSYNPPYPSGSVPAGQTAQCLSAENIVATYTTVFTQIHGDLGLAKNATAIAAGVTGIIGIFIPTAIIGTIALSLSAAAAAIGQVGVADLYSSDTLDKLRCNLNCHAGSDGSFTGSAYNAFYNQLSSDFSGAKLSIIQYYFDMLGPVGLSRQGAANGITSADCSSCDCTERPDFIITSNGSSASIVRLYGSRYRYSLAGASERNIKDRFNRCFYVTDIVAIAGTGFSTGYCINCDGSVGPLGNFEAHCIKESEASRPYTETSTIFEFTAVLC